MRNLFIQYKGDMQDLLRYGVLRTEAMEDYGLYGGKLGMVILFYEYSRYSGDTLYELFADEMMESLLELPERLPLGFSNGLIGIGWGITYLLRERFLEGDIDDILSELDKRLMKVGHLENDEQKGLFTYLNNRNIYLKQIEKNESYDFFSTSLAKMTREGNNSLYEDDEIFEFIWKNWSFMC